MSWICTFTGKAFDLLDPRPDQVDMRDIAKSLSRLPRFVGHSRQPYSVAQHSVLVFEITNRLLAERGLDEQQADLALKGALLHDAHEAYIGDIPTPVKDVIGRPAIEALSRAIDEAIAAHFGTVPLHKMFHAELVARADAIAFATEARDLMPKTERAWGAFSEPLAFTIVTPQPAEVAEAEFIEACAFLFPELFTARA